MSNDKTIDLNDLVVTENVASKVLKVVDKGLSYGTGSYGKPGSMCIEIAVNYALGGPDDDHPDCVNSLLADLKITINDQYDWKTNKIRANGMRRLAIAQLGTASSGFDYYVFEDKLRHVMVEKYAKPVTEVLRQKWFKDVSVKAIKKNLADISKAFECPIENISDVTDIVTDLQDEISELVSNVENDDEINSIKEWLDDDVDVRDNWHDLITLHISHVRKGRAKDKTKNALKEFAEDVVQVLIKMKTPGSKYLYLTEK